jgi:DNA helicase-2/ATP-dependent DNA helicase PcrA
VRYNALSREIEGALQRAGIPSRVIGGHKFFERMEVKDVLAYLQLADNPNFTVREGNCLM